MFSVSPGMVAALATGQLQVQVREVPLADVERHCSASLQSVARLVLVA